jgi:protein-disulfide isomerase
MRSVLNFICILVLSTVAVAQAAPAKSPATKPAPDKTEKTDAAASLPSESTVESFLQQTFGYEPSLSWKIASIKPTVGGLAEVTVILANPQGQQLSRFFVTSDGAHAVTGDIIPFGAKPFEPANKLLEKGVNGPDRGPKNAPVTVVEFGDLQCPACKAAQPSIEALYAAEPNVHFVFQNFPLEMHNWAAKGAAYADCVGRASNEAFWKFLAKDYDTQADITAENADEKLGAIVDSVGLKSADIAACAAKPETKARVEASLALGRSVEVTGTPTLYINGRKIGSFDAHMVDLYKGLIEFAAKETQDTKSTK